jgi:hypothetical protein
MTFKVPPQNVDITLEVGDIVTFSYESQLRKEIPVNAVIHRIRHDVDWGDVVNQYYRDNVHQDSMRVPYFSFY